MAKKYFNVTFKWSDTVYCSNIAIAESQEDVEKYYSGKYEWCDVKEASEWEIEEAKMKGKPIVTIEHEEKKEEKKMAKKAEVINVTFNDDNTATVTYSTGTIRPYKSIANLPKTALDWLESHKEPETIETATATAATELETEITPATAAAEYMTEIPEIIGNQINGFDFWYDTNIGKFIVLYCGDEVVFDSVADAWAFSKEMQISEREAELKAEVEAEAAETEEPEQDADEEPETEMEAAEEPETTEDVETITATESETETATEQETEEPERKEPAAMIPIIGKPETATTYKPASEAVAFGLCMVLAYAWFIMKGVTELLIIAIQNIWSHREEYAKKVRAFFREEIKPAAILAGYMAKDTATTAASWTMETGKQLATVAAIMAFMVRIYNN